MRTFQIPRITTPLISEFMQETDLFPKEVSGTWEEVSLDYHNGPYLSTAVDSRFLCHGMKHQGHSANSNRMQ